MSTLLNFCKSQIPLQEIPETHQQGHLSLENLELIKEQNLMDCDVGLQCSPNGKIWLCVNGIALIRFKPKK